MKWVDKILSNLFSKKNHFTISSENPDPFCPVTVLKIENDAQRIEWEQGYRDAIIWAVDNCTPDGNYPMPNTFKTRDILGSYGRGFMEGARYTGSQISDKYWNQKNKIQTEFFNKFPNKKGMIHGQSNISSECHRLNELYIEDKLMAIMYDDKNYQWHIDEF